MHQAHHDDAAHVHAKATKTATELPGGDLRLTREVGSIAGQHVMEIVHAERALTCLGAWYPDVEAEPERHAGPALGVGLGREAVLL